MPGRKWYAIATLIFLLGTAGSAILLFTRLSGLARELRQVVVPGEAELVLDKRGTYTIFHEYESVADGRYYSSEDVGGLQVQIVPLGSERGIRLQPALVSSTYALGGRSGRAILSAEIPQAGRYRLSAAYADGRNQPQTVLTIAQGVAGGIVTTILGALAIGFTASALAIGIAGVTFWKRYKARRSGPGGGPGLSSRWGRHSRSHQPDTVSRA